jgi:hypothetical protein
MADDKMWKPGMPIPQDIDGKSAGKVDKKDAPEQAGSGIIVDGKPLNERKPTKKAKGGSVSSRADGCCTKGKTKGRMV